MGNSMFITVLICTRDRAASLRATLTSLFCQTEAAALDWEIIVVYGPTGNGETAALCREFQATYPSRLRFLVETSPGKSNALNTGIAASLGNIIALTDDDVLCAPDYIESIRAVFNLYPADGVQGRILLDCEGGWPKWMDHEMAAFMSLRDLGDDAMEWNDNLAGTNMVLRREVIQNLGGFAPEVGASASGFMEDSEFSLRMRRMGCRLIYAPQIIVRHQVPRCRLTKSFFRERYFRWGRSEAYLSPLPSSLWRYGLYMAKELALREAQALLYLCAGQHARALRLQCHARRNAGFFWQYWLFRLGHSRKLTSPKILLPGMDQ